MRPTGRRVRYDDMELAAALDYVRTNHQAVLYTRRADGSPQLSPITLDVDDAGQVVISSRETAYKVNNLRRDPRAALCAFSKTFHGEGWVQVSGTAEIVSLPAALDTLVYLQRQSYGEHKSWPEFHERMVREKRVIIRITIESVGPKVRG